MVFGSHFTVALARDAAASQAGLLAVLCCAVRCGAVLCFGFLCKLCMRGAQPPSVIKPTSARLLRVKGGKENLDAKFMLKNGVFLTSHRLCPVL
jgi:hypothetical protein